MSNRFSSIVNLTFTTTGSLHTIFLCIGECGGAINSSFMGCKLSGFSAAGDAHNDLVLNRIYFAYPPVEGMQKTEPLKLEN